MTWTIDGDALTVRDVTATHRTMSLTATVLDVAPWRQYDRVGDYQVPVASDGDYRAIDRSGGTTVSVSPAASDSPPFDAFDAFVASYEETQVAPDRSELSLTLQRASNRDRSVTDPAGTGAWTLELSQGRLGLDEDQVLLSSVQGTTVDGEWTLPVLLDAGQAEVVLASLSHVDAVAERPVPDAADQLVDATTDDRNTLSIDAPTRATLPSGEYIARGITLSQYTESRWRADLSLVLENRATTIAAGQYGGSNYGAARY